MAKKLYIRTFGCQMNEYDSDKMADVLAAAEDVTLTDTPRGRGHHPVQHLLGAREGAGARVPRPRPRARAEGGESGPHHRRRRLRREPGRRGASSAARPYVDVVFGPQTLHRLPAADRRRRESGRAAGRHLVPGDREVRPPAAAARRGRRGVRLDHGRLQQVLHVLRRALHARRGSLAPARRRAGRGRRPRRPGRDGGHPARAERQRLPRAARARTSPTSRRCSSTSPRSRASSASATRPRTRAR